MFASDLDPVTSLTDWPTDIRHLLDSLDPLPGVPDNTLMGLALEVETVRQALDALSLAVVGELAARGTTEITDGLTTRRWLAANTPLSGRTATRTVRLATTLRTELPATETAMRAGQIGIEHAGVMANAINPRIADQFRQLEEELVDMADGTVFETWRTHVTTIAALLDQDGSYNPDEDLLNNRITLRPSPDGTIVSGTLVGDCAITVNHALDAIATEIRTQHRADAEQFGTDPTPEPTIRALALAELCRRALETPRGTAAKVEATLVIHSDNPNVVYDTHNHGHRVEAVGALVCDCDVTAIIVDHLGLPLDLGRAERFFTRDQRRALGRRDGGCAFPGCNAPVHRTDAHHVDHWTLGGYTDIGRGVLLCRYHHGVMHRTGWDIDLTPNGQAIITAPNGQRRWGQHHQRQHTGPLPPTPLPPPASPEHRWPTPGPVDEHIARYLHRHQRPEVEAERAPALA